VRHRNQIECAAPVPTIGRKDLLAKKKSKTYHIVYKKSSCGVGKNPTVPERKEKKGTDASRRGKLERFLSGGEEGANSLRGQGKGACRKNTSEPRSQEGGKETTPG